MFMNESDLQQLTGYMRNADQRRWLTRHGWRFEEARNGKPIVSVAYAESRLSDSQKKPEWTPNFAVFNKKAA